MKKIILLICLMVMLSGCTAEVNIDLTEKKVSEDIKITAESDSLNSKESLKGAFRQYMPVDKNVIIPDTDPDVKQRGIKYYKQDTQELGNGYIFNYKYDFDFNDYNNATSLNRVFKSSSLELDRKEKELTFYTDNGGIILMDEYPSFTNLVVNIKTDLKLIETNADQQKDGVYTWIFNNGSDNKGIYLKLSTKKEINNNKNKEDVSAVKKVEKKENPYDKYLIFIIPGIIVIFIFIVVIINKIAKAKYNQ